MAQKDDIPSFSLHALVEQTARILRNAAKQVSKRDHLYSKETNRSNRSKIERIAYDLRSQAKKSHSARRKKKK